MTAVTSERIAGPRLPRVTPDPALRYYVHGAGRGGRDAWPAQAGETAVFADHSPYALMVDRAQAVREHAPDGPVVVVAHSIGAVAVALARAGSPALRLSRAVLVEPALYDVGRGDPAVELHVAQMGRARGCAAEGDLFGFWEVVAPLMFGRPARREGWTEDRPLAERFAAMEPPWGHGLDPSCFADVPTLVLTGGWNAEYDAIARRLVEHGAEHVELRGHGHRPQDHPGFADSVAGFLARV